MSEARRIRCRNGSRIAKDPIGLKCIVRKEVRGGLDGDYMRAVHEAADKAYQDSFGNTRRKVFPNGMVITWV